MTFVWFDTKDGKVYELGEQYAERKRELERQGGKKTEEEKVLSQEEVNVFFDTKEDAKKKT